VFPVNGSLTTWHPPSLERVLVSPVPRRHWYYEGATTPTLRIIGRLFVSLPVPTRVLLHSCSLMPALPSGWRPAAGQDHCSAGDPIAGSLSRGREWDISGFQATHPVPLLRSTTPAGPTFPCHWRYRRCCPCWLQSKGSSVTSISRLPRSFSTCCLRFMGDVATAHARLASGWLAHPCREGVEPSGSRWKVSELYISSPLPGFIL